MFNETIARLNAFKTSDGGLQGTSKVVIEKGVPKFVNPLTGDVFSTAREAKASGEQYGLAEYRSGRRGGNISRFRNLQNQRLQALQASLGDGQTVEVFSFNTEGDQARKLEAFVEQNKRDGAVFIDDAHKMRMIRIINSDGKVMSQDLFDNALKKVGIEIDLSTSKFGKRGKRLLAPREIDSNMERLRTAVYDPNKLGSEALEHMNLGKAYERETHQLVMGAYKKGETERMKGALRQLTKDGYKDIEPENIERMSEGNLRRHLKRGAVKVGREKAVDGSGVINHDAIKRLQKTLEEELKKGGLSREQTKTYRGMLDKVSKIKVGQVYNASITGEIVRGLGPAFEEVAEVFTGKGNLVVASSEAFKRTLAKLGVKDEGIDILTSKSNIHTGIGWKGASLGLENQKASLHPTLDILSAAHRNILTPAELDNLTDDIGSAMDTIKELAAGGGINNESRGYGALKASLEEQADSPRNVMNSRVSRMLLDKINNGKPLSPREVANLSARVVDSLTKTKNGKLMPVGRVVSGDAMPMLSEAEMRNAGLFDGPGLTEAGTTTTKYARVMSNLSALTRHHVHGGFDFDDKMNVLYKKGPNGELVGLAFRQPNAANEISVLMVQDPHKDESIRRLVNNMTTKEERKAEHELYRWLKGHRDAVLPERGVHAFADIIPGLNSIDLDSADLAVEEVSEAIKQGRMNRFVDGLSEFDGDISSRLFSHDDGVSLFKGLPELHNGKMVYPGVKSPFKFEFDLLGTLEDANITDDTGKVTTRLGALTRVKESADNSSVLGKWVNARGGLDTFLATNHDEIVRMIDEAGGIENLPTKMRSLFGRLAEQEQVIDKIVQLGGGASGEVKAIEGRAREIWETLSDLTRENENLKLDRFYTTSKMPSDLLSELVTRNGGTDELGEIFTSGTMTKVQTKVEEVVDVYRGVMADLGRGGYGFDGLSTSKGAESNARRILERVSSAGDDLELLGAEATSLARGQVALEEIVSLFDSVGDERVMGREAAETYAVLARSGKLNRAALGVVAASVDSEALNIMRGGQSTATASELFGASSGQTEVFKKGARNLLGKEFFNELEQLNPGTVLGSIAEDGFRLEVGHHGLSPMSLIETADGEMVSLADHINDGNNAGSAKSMQYPGMSPRAEKALDIDTVRKVAGNQVAPKTSMYKEYQEATARTGAPPETFKRGIGSMMDEVSAALSNGGGMFEGKNLRGIGAGALVAIAGAMVYNSKRDKDYTKEMMLSAEGMESMSPYEQELAMTSPNMVGGGGGSALGGAESYRIRTRGGNFSTKFLQDVAQITGQDIQASTYRDGLMTERESIMKKILTNY